MKNKFGITVTLFIVALLVFAASLACATELQMAPLNPEFVQYQAERAKGVVVSKSEHPMGYVPSPLDLSHIKGSDITVFRSKALKTLPSAYDLRTAGYMTAVKDQDPYGTCWAFAALASLESNFLKSSGTTYDFSEWSLAYWAYVDESTSMPAFTKHTVDYGKDLIFDQGGNSWQATAILARWTGAVNEADRPYQNVNLWTESSRPLASDPVAKHLEHTYFLGSDLDATVVKNAIMEYGALDFSILWSNSAYNSTNYSYYNVLNNGDGHGVTLAGWDDNYPAANFNTNPGSDGAWLVKNSWGTGFGDGGYFWLSYADPTIKNPSVFVGAAADNFDYIYQYDPLGWCHGCGCGFNSSTAWFANVFTSKGIAGDSETLEAISFYTAAANSSYEIEVWTGGAGGNPRSGTSAMTPQRGTLSIPGYHTVRLISPVALPVGTRFSVVVKLTTPGYNYPIPMEKPIDGYSENATALADQSYISSDGTSWEDFILYSANTNVCLKAFTSKGSTPTPTPTPPAPTPSSGGGGCSIGYAPAVILFTLPLLLLKR